MGDIGKPIERRVYERPSETEIPELVPDPEPAAVPAGSPAPA